MNESQAAIVFTTKACEIKGQTVVQLPNEASKLLPSRGQVSVEAQVNGTKKGLVLEPDGNWGHWFKTDELAPEIQAGDTVNVILNPTKLWPEPTIPPDLATALQTTSDDVKELWTKITPMARWEWVRWVNETVNPVTRQRRVEISISKMHNGKRRPCCFNLSACTDPTVSKSGRLLTPTA